jgi:hypothetical protein
MAKNRRASGEANLAKKPWRSAKARRKAEDNRDKITISGNLTAKLAQSTLKIKRVTAAKKQKAAIWRRGNAQPG